MRTVTREQVTEAADWCEAATTGGHPGRRWSRGDACRTVDALIEATPDGKPSLATATMLRAALDGGELPIGWTVES